ncbi:D-sedoheptulose-7-phosphate isomerase [Nonomuraea insulae]|uniref:SIS domain-containing protein n=1 Tax=Nonomuraea insulae TaxID=1616787 RepID=A0ABW1D940_9ACTN
MNDHVQGLVTVLTDLDEQVRTITDWGNTLAKVLGAGGRLLVCGNGGSAAEAQHLTAELVGRYKTERQPYAAIPLHSDSSSFTAIANDFGAEEVFSRQVRAHGRTGDVLLCLSTSGRSKNILAANQAAQACGLTTWALTGAAPNPLSERADDAVAVPVSDTAIVQEVHLVLIHMLCDVVEEGRT